MTLYTEGLIARPGRNVLDDVVTGQFDAAEAAFDQAWFENPVSATRRINELTRAQQGPIVSPAYPAWGIDEVRAEPETPLLTAEEARARVKESGLDITIDDAGIRAGALDILIERKREERERQLVLQNAPASTVPVQLLAGFAASAIDPINLAAGFVPVVGQARYASMLAQAGSRAARFGVRARVGALQGAVGTAAVEPLILYASEMDQADYGLADSLLNVAFGTVLGGGLHASGGYLSDLRTSRLLTHQDGGTAATGAEGVELQPAQRSPLAEAIARGDDDPMLALRQLLERGLQADRQNILNAAQIRAREELLPTIRAELEEVAAGRIPNVGTLRTEQGALQRSLDQLDDTFRPLAKEFQQQRMTRKQAERAAREAIAEERQRLNARLAEINDALDTNRQSELARAELARIDRGELPERYAGPVTERAAEIANGFELRQTARAVAEAAPWEVRESALRSAVAQAVSGRAVDVEPVFDMASPGKRPQAIERLKNLARPEPDPEGTAMSQRADQAVRESATADELESMQRALSDDESIAREMAEQVGFDLDAALRDANLLLRDADVFSRAARAAAVCQLRT